MPKEGFTSITFKNATFDVIDTWWRERKFNLSAFGINSVSALATTILISSFKKDGEHLTKVMETEIDKIE